MFACLLSLSLSLLNVHLPENNFFQKAPVWNLNQLISSCLGRENQCFEEISYILLWCLHVWLSTKLQSWHFNQTPSEVSFFQIRDAAVENIQRTTTLKTNCTKIFDWKRKIVLSIILQNKICIRIVFKKYQYKMFPAPFSLFFIGKKKKNLYI